MTGGVAPIHRSASTWQQPVPSDAPPARAAVLGRMAERVSALGPGRLRVAVDGRTAAGKTSFGHELAERISAAGRAVLRASLDDFKKPWRDRHLYDRESGEGFYRNAFDVDAIRRLLLEPGGPTGSGQVVLCSIDPLTEVDHSGAMTSMAPDAVLVVDGVFALRPELVGHWDLRIWLEVPAALSLERGVNRDEGTWAGSQAEAIHRDRYAVAERVYLREVDPVALADVVIDNRDLADPKILTWS